MTCRRPPWLLWPVSRSSHARPDRNGHGGRRAGPSEIDFWVSGGPGAPEGAGGGGETKNKKHKGPGGGAPFRRARRGDGHACTPYTYPSMYSSGTIKIIYMPAARGDSWRSTARLVPAHRACRACACGRSSWAGQGCLHSCVVTPGGGFPHISARAARPLLRSRSAQRCLGLCCVGIEAMCAWPPGLAVCWLPGGAGEDGT